MPFVAIDAGNTEIVFGVLDEEKIFFSSRLKTDRFKTSDEYAVILLSLLHMHGMDPSVLEGGIISSVVPSLKTVMQDAVYSISGKYCMIVGPGLKNGLRIRIDNPAQLGSDLVAEAVAAAAEYPKPILILDLGTATTVSVLDKNGAYRGGMIMPGTIVSLEALVGRTALLPHISLADGPSGVIGTNSHDCIVNGTIYGSAAMLDGVIERLAGELDTPPTVVATGDVGELIIPYCKNKIVLDKELLLKGLRIIYLRNRKV
ncbi:MAG: type III pantothenate kinase [Eubacterium sp.]|nr:type III pantothenate kinase [Eubacterium sp.]